MTIGSGIAIAGLWLGLGLLSLGSAAPGANEVRVVWSSLGVGIVLSLVFALMGSRTGS